MPRTARIVIPGYPHHVMQRGHNRQVTFIEDLDYLRYLTTLREQKSECRVKVLAWCLMTNHVHLLLMPEDATGLGRLMKRLAGRQTRHYNRLEGRSGTLWEGRYKSSVVQHEGYLRACCRYIELNPVRARMVARPEDYPWSSCRQRLGLERASLLDTPDGDCVSGTPPRAWDADWPAFLQAAILTSETTLIRSAVQRGQLTGDESFKDEVAALSGLRLERRGRGRPRESNK